MFDLQKEFPNVPWKPQKITDILGECAETYVKKFKEWEALEEIFDDEKALYTLRNPNYVKEKVCMYVDGNGFMMLYGEYGSFAFDRMTWQVDPYTLNCHELSYMLGKASKDSEEAIYIFDAEKCKEDLYTWFKLMFDGTKLRDDAKAFGRICEILDSAAILSTASDYEDELETVLNEFGFYDDDFRKEVVMFVFNALGNMNDGKFSWQMFLNNSHGKYENMENDDILELCEAGKKINPSVLISLLAIFICGAKLRGEM